MPPAALMAQRAEPACRFDRNRDLAACIVSLRGAFRQCEADKAALAAWRAGAEQAARPQEKAQGRGWWPWHRE